MNITISTKISRDTKKIWYYLEWGRGKGQRKASGVFTYAKPGNQIQKNHNKEALAILETKKSQMILDMQAIKSGYTPQHKIKSNFMDYYREFAERHARKGNRHLIQSLNSFQKFMGKSYVSPIEVTESTCEQFRKYLLDNLNGETPANYFSRFKRVLEAARKDGYFKVSPAADLSSKSKSNKKIKEILTAEEYTKL